MTDFSEVSFHPAALVHRVDEPSAYLAPYKDGTKLRINLKLIHQAFPAAELGSIFQLLQGSPPHHNFFRLERTSDPRGYKLHSHGLLFATSALLRVTERITLIPIIKSTALYLDIPLHLHINRNGNS